jgi:hypothetical protein
MGIIIKFLFAISLFISISLPSNATTLSAKQLKIISKCAKKFENKSLSPISTVIVISHSAGYFLLSVADKKNPGWDFIVKVNPCTSVFANPMGDNYSKYNVKGLPRSITDDLERQRVRYLISKYGKEKYFSSILKDVRNNILILLPENYKALLAEGFKVPSSVKIVSPKTP